MKNRLAIALAALVLTASVAWADYNVLDKTTYYQNATNGAKTNATGDATVDDNDRDRDFPLIEQLFSAQTLTAGQSYIMTTAQPSLQFTRAALMLSWAIAAADSDSVRIAVRVWGTTSPTSGNYHLWTPSIFSSVVADNDTCNGSGYVAADTTATTAARCLAPLSFWVQKSWANMIPRMGYLASNITQNSSVIPAAGQIGVRKIPFQIIRMASANGVMLNLVDNAGAPCPFPYIIVQVTNAGRQSLTNVECNLWNRVQ